MGIVYEVIDEYTGVRRALKLMTVGVDEPRRIARFARDARLASIAEGDHVVNVIETDVANELGGRPYVVMDLLRGRNVAQIIASRGRFSFEDALDVLSQLAIAVDRVHEAGIVHGRLEASSLFLHEPRDREGAARVVLKVLDFGVAELAGTDGSIATAADRAAIARIAVAMLGGAELPNGFDAWFERSCASATSTNEDCFETARDQIDALRSVLSEIRPERSVAPVAYVPLDEGMPVVRPGLSGDRVMKAAGLASAGITLLLLGVLVGRALFGRDATRPTAGATATVAREAVVERNELVVPDVMLSTLTDDDD